MSNGVVSHCNVFVLYLERVQCNCIRKCVPTIKLLLVSEYLAGKEDSSGTTKLHAERTRLKYIWVVLYPAIVRYAELVLYLSNPLVETVVNYVVSEDLPSLWKAILKIIIYMK